MCEGISVMRPLPLLGGGETGAVNGKIENNRWYDIRIETAGGHIKCYLDNKLIHDVDPPKVRSLFASARAWCGITVTGRE